MNFDKNSVLFVLLNLLFLLKAVQAQDCFVSNAELTDAVDDYVLDPGNPSSTVALRYGWPINTWCVDNIEDFSEVFSGIRNADLLSFNEDVSGWNTTSAIYMDFMFNDAELFNQPLEGWNTSRVTNMEYMFEFAESFNQPLEGWDTSGVTTMAGMFAGTESFNQPLEGWDTSSVTTMEYMFENALLFNQSLEGFNTSSVTTMEGMFAGAVSFNQPLEGWDARTVTNMDQMFNGAILFNQDLCPWGPQLQGSSVQTLNMFAGTSCPSTSSPELTASPPGPFCVECLSTVVPSSQASIPPTKVPTVVPQSTNLPSSSPAPTTTDQPSLQPTRENQLNVNLLPFYVSLRLPSAGPDDEPSQNDFEQLRVQTENFLDKTFRDTYMTGRRRQRGLQNLDFVYGSVSLVTVGTQYRGGIPEPSFNIYAGYGGTVIFYGRNATMNETPPTQDDLADLINESNTTEYISDYVSEIPAFDGVDDIRTGAVDDVVSFSPTVSRVPSNLPSPYPSILPSPMPSFVPSPSPTMSPSKEVCPCKRFRLLCRLVRFRLCIRR